MRTCAQYLTVAHRKESKEHRAKTYHILVLLGKLRMAVQWITERDTGCVLSPEEHLHKVRGEGDGGAALKTSGYTPLVRG